MDIERKFQLPVRNGDLTEKEPHPVSRRREPRIAQQPGVTAANVRRDPCPLVRDVGRDAAGDPVKRTVDNRIEDDREAQRLDEPEPPAGREGGLEIKAVGLGQLCGPHLRGRGGGPQSGPETVIGDDLPDRPSWDVAKRRQSVADDVGARLCARRNVSLGHRI